MVDGRTAIAALALGLALVLGALTPSSLAHNPADTLYHPVPVGDDLLVVGGEGTYAYLSEEGEVRQRGNLSGDGEVIGPPVSLGSSAAVLVRTFPDLALELRGFDARGPTWTLEVEPPEAEAFGYLAAGEDTFAAFTTEARQVLVSPGGEVLGETEVPATPEARPAHAVQGGWWVPLPGELVRFQDGQPVDRVSYEGTATDVTVTEGRVLVSLTHRSQGEAELLVLDHEGQPAFSRTLAGLRLGGSPAATEGRIVVGTYDPDGARLVAFDARNGSELWDRQRPGATALAPAPLGGSVAVAGNEALAVYEADGTQRWSQPARPYLASPAVLEGLVVPSGAGNEIQAFWPNGTQAWTFSDGVAMPSWSHHERGGDEAETEADGGAAETPALGAGLALALVAAAAATRPIGS